jgi:chromate transporter
MSSIETLPDTKAAPNLSRIADVFVRYANFTLGGGSATIAVLHRELLEKSNWISNDDFTLCFALARLTPGTNLLAFCTGVGWLRRRLPGRSRLYLRLRSRAPWWLSGWQRFLIAGRTIAWAQGAIHGAVAAAVAITAKTSWTIAKPHYKRGNRLRVILIGASAFGLHVGLGIPAIQVLLLAGIVGAFASTSSLVCSSWWMPETGRRQSVP